MNLEDRSQAYLDQRLQVKTVPSSNQTRNAVSLTDDMTFFTFADAHCPHVSNLHDLTMKPMRYSTHRITV